MTKENKAELLRKIIGLFSIMISISVHAATAQTVTLTITSPANGTIVSPWASNYSDRDPIP